jgi:hypothetical protein
MLSPRQTLAVFPRHRPDDAWDGRASMHEPAPVYPTRTRHRVRAIRNRLAGRKPRPGSAVSGT